MDTEAVPCLGFVSSFTMNIGVYLSFHIYLDMCPGGGLLGQTVTLSLVSEEPPFCSPHRQH